MSQGAASEPLALRRLVTVAGAHTYAQRHMADDLHARLGAVEGARQIQQVLRFVFAHSAIDQRHLERSIEEIDARDDWYPLVNEATESLAARALDALFAGDDARHARECDALIVVSSSWAGFPSLGRRLQERYGLRLDAPVYDLGGLGCAGPTQGLQLAAMLLADPACRSVCLLAVDAMGTHGQARRHKTPPTMSQLVAHCLASDGAAAVIVGRGRRAGDLLRFAGARLASRLWAGSLDLNDLTADDGNQPYLSVGKAIRTRIVDELGPLLEADGGRALAEPILFHPGGAALMRLLAERWPVLSDTIELSVGMLARNGNVGAPSVLLVLEEALRARRAVAPTLRLCALGPGIVTTVLRLDGCEAGAAA